MTDDDHDGGALVPVDGDGASDVAHVPVAPIRGLAPEAELDSIRELRKRNPKAYFRDNELLARERELLAQGLGQPSEMSTDTTYSKPTPPGHIRNWLMGSAVGQRLVGQWNRGGFNEIVKRAQDTANGFLAGLPDRQDFEDAFSGLPDAVQHACMGEMASGMRTLAPPAPDALVNLWAKRSPVGEALVRQWGQSLAAKKVGIIRARLFGVIDRLETVEQVEDFCAWIDRIPENESIILWRRLAR